MFSVWFECKTCRGSFLEVSHFLEHKKQDHFDEFQNTECIIFEERRIPNHEQPTVSFQPPPQDIAETNLHEFIDPQTIKIDNFDDHSSSEFQSHTDQTLNFFEPDYTIGSDQDFENETDDFISSNNGASATHSVSTFISKNSTTTNGTCLDQDSCRNTKTILDLENKADAAINVDADAFISLALEPTQLFIETQRNPFVLLKRITCQEIQRWSGTDSKRTRSVKYAKKANSFVHSIERCFDKTLNNLFECKLCLDKFNTDLKLTAHTNSCILSHPNRARFCAPCNKIFSTSDGLKRHVVRNHPEEQKHVKSKKLKKCQLCSKTFLYEYDLNRHTLTHSTKNKMQKPSVRPFNSQRGETSIINKYKLPQGPVRHAAEKTINKQSIDKTYPKIPKTKTNDNDRLRMSISVGSGSIKFNCNQPRCSKTFQSKSQLEKHMITHSGARPFKCPKLNCTKTFTRKDHVRFHTIYVHKNSGLRKRHQVISNKIVTGNSSSSKLAPSHLKREQFKCPIPSCPQTFKNKKSIRLHIILHSAPRQFKCTQINCKKTFRLRHCLSRHLSTHSDAKPFKCCEASCEKSFRTSYGARNHMEGHSDLLLKKCPEVGCKKMYKKKQSLREHLLTHQYLKPLTCSGIETDKETNANLQGTQSAIKIFSGPFECNHPNCGKLFPSRYKLTRHKATHLDARPFKCTEPSCLRAFKQKYYLLAHVKIHSRSKLGRKNDFKTHNQNTEDASSKSTTKDQEAFSTDLMSFKCNKLNCGKQFWYKFNLKKHLLTVHSDKRPFKCPVPTCDYSCKEKGNLKAHLRAKKHADIQNSLTD